jgi:hypothetical protein
LGCGRGGTAVHCLLMEGRSLRLVEHWLGVLPKGNGKRTLGEARLRRL